jgi:hypothetical protein
MACCPREGQTRVQQRGAGRTCEHRSRSSGDMPGWQSMSSTHQRRVCGGMQATIAWRVEETRVNAVPEELLPDVGQALEHGRPMGLTWQGVEGSVEGRGCWCWR